MRHRSQLQKNPENPEAILQTFGFSGFLFVTNVVL